MSQNVHKYVHKDNDIHEIIFYITQSSLPYYSILDLIRLDKKCIIAWSSLAIYKKDNKATLTWIKTQKENRKKGYASTLLYHMIEYCRQYGFSEINLDDMTDNYRKDNNLYIKHGFKYLDDNGPEMVLCL
jgi:ribosomal protein S18 acetylase RimI-like enzyme